MASIRPTEFLAKKEVGATPFVRAVLALQGVALVDRRKRTGIPAVNADIARRMRGGAAVILFAEATTGDANRLLRFRSSHFEAVRHTLRADQPDHAVIQPVYIAYSRRTGLPVGRPERPEMAWYGDMTFLDHFWRVLAAGRIDCDIYWGAPIPFFRDSNRKDVARRTEGAVRALARAARAPTRGGGRMSAYSRARRKRRRQGRTVHEEQFCPKYLFGARDEAKGAPGPDYSKTPARPRIKPGGCS